MVKPIHWTEAPAHCTQRQGYADGWSDCLDAVKAEQATRADSTIITDVLAERTRQDEQWGGPAHDDEHCPWEWREYIEYQLQKSRKQPTQFRECLIKIAALAIAAVESIDRKPDRNDGGEYD